MSNSQCAEATRRPQAEASTASRALARDESLASLLASMPILVGLAPRSIARLAAAARLQKYGRRSPVFDRGSEPTGLFFVVSGGVKLVAMGADNRSRVVELFERGRMFGEIGVFTGKRYRTWTEAIELTTLIHVDASAVLATVNGDHELTRRMLASVTARMQRLIDSIGVASPATADVRVAAYLLELAGDTSTAEAPSLTLPASKGTIASLLNLSQESLSRTLRRLMDAGVLRVTGRRIRICDRDKLLELTTSQSS